MRDSVSLDSGFCGIVESRAESNVDSAKNASLGGLESIERGDSTFGKSQTKQKLLCKDSRLIRS